MTNPTKPGRYRVTFKSQDSKPEGDPWYYHGSLTFDGLTWLLNSKPCNMAGAEKWEKIQAA